MLLLINPSLLIITNGKIPAKNPSKEGSLVLESLFKFANPETTCL